jgi:hypothetical protein
MRHAELPSTTLAIFRPLQILLVPNIFVSREQDLKTGGVGSREQGVPWSNSTSIAHGGRANADRRRFEATSGEIEHCLNLLARHVKLFDDLFDI